MTERAIVVGGGLAGIAAALRLADAGRPVTLLEKRPRLGGAAFSFRRGELDIDNGQHVFLRCCTAYRALLDRIGASHLVSLQPRLDIPVLAPSGRRARISRVPGVPAPAHLGPALAAYSLLSPADRVRAARGAIALRRLRPGDRALDAQSLGAFLRRHGQNAATVERLWGVIATATLNLAPDEASLALAAKVFRTGLLDHAAAADVGWAGVPLCRIHHDAAQAALERSGVECRLDTAVDSVEPCGVVTFRGPGRTSGTLRGSTVVLAVPHRAAFAAVPGLRTSAAAVAEDLGSSPIVNVHVVYERRVTDLPFAAAVGSRVQWFFDRTGSSGLRTVAPDAQYLAVTVSAAHDTVGVPSRDIAGRFVAELAELLPGARGVGVRDVFVTRERSATFRQSPGTWALRPRATDGPHGVFLAGAWVDTGWPDTMESAVRSGVIAAEASLGLPPSQRSEFAA